MSSVSLPRVVLIADRLTSFATENLRSTQLEKLTDEYFAAVYDSLKRICGEVIHYHEPSTFLEQISSHTHDLVFSLWSGELSRNRRALIPSICEAYGLKYVGADTYTNIVCQDKFIAKRIARNCGFKTSKGILVYRESELELLRALKPPWIVKPNFQGGSIGISSQSLTSDLSTASELAAELLELFHQPVLIEEFCAGPEASICVLGHQENIVFLECAELLIQGDEKYLLERPHGLESKKVRRRATEHRIITHLLSVEELKSARELFAKLDKVEMLRIDGRFTADGFRVIELTPDISFAPTATYPKCFLQSGISYDEMMFMVLENALRTQEEGSASMK